MKTTPLQRFRGGRLIGSLMLFLLAAACDPPGRFADYRDNHPLVVGEARVALHLDVPLAGRPLSLDDSRNLKGFVNDYVNRGTTAITVEMKAGEDGPFDQAITQRTLNLLMDAGIRLNEISIRKARGGASGGGAVILSFTAKTVIVPECGDWSTEAAYNWSNRVHGNYGCSFQRNLGLNVADPGDLKKAKPESGRDAMRTGAVTSGYRAGAAPAAAVPAAE